MPRFHHLWTINLSIPKGHTQVSISTPVSLWTILLCLHIYIQFHIFHIQLIISDYIYIWLFWIYIHLSLHIGSIACTQITLYNNALLHNMSILQYNPIIHFYLLAATQWKYITIFYIWYLRTIIYILLYHVFIAFHTWHSLLSLR